jgi:hypothetical protein
MRTHLGRIRRAEREEGGCLSGRWSSEKSEPQGDDDSVSLRGQQVAQVVALGLRDTVLQLNCGGLASSKLTATVNFAQGRTTCVSFWH